VLDALAEANQKHVQSDMIVKGGATLTDRVADESVERALTKSRYDYVILQERGGDLTCSFGPLSCKNANLSLATLAHIVLAHGATPISLGTYQALPRASAELLTAEVAAAERASVAYISVSDRLQAAFVSASSAEWLYADGMHPGHELTLLDASLIYRRVFGALPGEKSFSVSAPMYAPKMKFSEITFANQGPTAQDGSSNYSYSAGDVAIVLAIARIGSQ